MIKILILIVIIVVGYFIVKKTDFLKNFTFLENFNFFNSKPSEEVKKELDIVKEDSEEDINTDNVEDFFNKSTNDEEIEHFFNDNEVKKVANVYLDVKLNNQVGRILIELNMDKTPKTSTNFINLCSNKAYKNVPFHRVIKDFMIQGGDTTNHDGTGGISSFENPMFEDENFSLKHEKYCISMANSGPNTNGSQFFITLKDTPWLDGKHVVFGKVTKGFDIIDYIGNLQTDKNDKPNEEILIVDSGEL